MVTAHFFPVFRYRQRKSISCSNDEKHEQKKSNNKKTKKFDYFTTHRLMGQ